MANDKPEGWTLGSVFKVQVKKNGPVKAPVEMVEDEWEVRAVSLETGSVHCKSKVSGNVATSIADCNKMVVDKLLKA